jgi:Domain of unknown function (DUF4041)/Meiotically up-regulated gene 113
MSLTLIALVILVLVLLIALVQAKLKQSQLRQRLRRYEAYKALDDKEGYQRQLESNIHVLESQQESLNTQIINRQQQLRELDAKLYLQSIDSYEPKYDYTSAKSYVLLLDSTHAEQDEMRETNQAFICHKEFILNQNSSEGKKMIKDILSLIELAFENQCKYIIKKVKYNNVESLQKELENTFTRINKLSQTTKCEISRKYLNLKIRELTIKYEIEDREQKEREIQQEIKKQHKQSESIEKAKQKAKDAEEREKRHQQELEEVRREIEQAEGERRKQLEVQIMQLEEQLAKDKTDKEKANQVKWGYIYIISNVGSLGRDVYRIFMTYRQNENETIRNMNPVVPFKFDVHFKIFSEDAFDTLERLHQRFDDKRVNLENPRREFFKVSMNEIEQVVQEIQKQTGILRIEEFEPVPQAYEYRQTLAARKKHQQATTNDTYLEVDEIA